MTTTTAPVLFSVSISPHIRSAETTSRIIWAVNASLAPAAVMGAWYFGLKALLTMALCIGAAVGSEYLYQRLLRKKSTIRDGSAFLTGLLLAFNLPPQLPWYVPVLG
ncbi:MAG: RnfABCDGE type electron transport complex subunit D, partial [Chitinispirillaceae bacterium]|nr:RnfABCDGE type electron transport complex subunit D [Chitinispirillaceae bacterium]